MKVTVMKIKQTLPIGIGQAFLVVARCIQLDVCYYIVVNKISVQTDVNDNDVGLLLGRTSSSTTTTISTATTTDNIRTFFSTTNIPRSGINKFLQ
jgi:hypothetical protein